MHRAHGSDGPHSTTSALHFGLLILERLARWQTFIRYPAMNVSTDQWCGTRRERPSPQECRDASSDHATCQ